MTVREACHTLRIWDTVKAHAEVWRAVGTYPTFQAVQATIKRGYRTQASESHPDHGGTEAAFAGVRDAYDLLAAADGNAFVGALDEIAHHEPGSEACRGCTRWNRTFEFCLTGECTGFKPR